MKRVLLITYDFPPLGGGAVLRTQKFAKYLPKFGWEPVIVTAKKPIYGGDESLLKELGAGVNIYRVYSPEKFGIEKNLSKNFVGGNKIKRSLFSNLLGLWCFLKNRIIVNLLVPDRCIGWVPFAYKECRRIIKEQKIDIIYTSSPPISAHLVGYLLKRTMKVPWVMDYRDLWLSHIIFTPKWFPGKLAGYLLEKAFISRADKVISATVPITEDFLRRYGDVKGLKARRSSEKFITITNGYDKEVFEHIYKTSFSKKAENKFTIVYSGSLSNYQSAGYFIKAVNELISKHSDLRDDLEIIFSGGIEERYSSEAEIKFLGFLSYEESARLMSSADVLLLVIYESSISGSIFTTKIFDYIGARRPILGLIPDGVAADLMRNEDLGIVVSPRDISGIKSAILDLYGRWKEKKLYMEADYDKLSKEFSREYLTRKLSEVLQGAIK